MGTIRICIQCHRVSLSETPVQSHPWVYPPQRITQNATMTSTTALRTHQLRQMRLCIEIAFTVFDASGFDAAFSVNVSGPFTGRSVASWVRPGLGGTTGVDILLQPFG